jgi:hypothetical protein
MADESVAYAVIENGRSDLTFALGQLVPGERASSFAIKTNEGYITYTDAEDWTVAPDVHAWQSGLPSADGGHLVYYTSADPGAPCGVVRIIRLQGTVS